MESWKIGNSPNLCWNAPLHQYVLLVTVAVERHDKRNIVSVTAAAIGQAHFTVSGQLRWKSFDLVWFDLILKHCEIESATFSSLFGATLCCSFLWTMIFSRNIICGCVGLLFSAAIILAVLYHIRFSPRRVCNMLPCPVIYMYVGKKCCRELLLRQVFTSKTDEKRRGVAFQMGDKETRFCNDSSKPQRGKKARIREARKAFRFQLAKKN